MLNWLKGSTVDHPLANAKDAKKVIGEFPYGDPWKTLEDANYWLASINDTPEFKTGHRIETLLMLNEATRKSHDQLLATYVKLPEGERTQERRIWKTASDFWALLGTGYLACVAQAQEAQDAKGVTKELKAQMPLLLLHTLRALRQQLKWVLMRYGALRGDLWQDIARCLTLGEATGTFAVSVEIQPGAAMAPSGEFLRTMMLWASSPGGLSPIEQDVADRVAGSMTPNFCYNGASAGDCEYCFDTAPARAPLRLTRSTPVSAATRYFDASAAHQALQAGLAQLVRGGIAPQGFDTGPAADTNTVARVLRHLNINWAKEMPSRAFERRRTALKLEVVHGYAQVLGTIDPAAAGGLDMTGGIKSDSWVADDASTGGYGVVAPAGHGEWLRVGMLLALRSELESSWSLGVIRRVKGDEHKQFRAGIQLISRQPVPVQLRTMASASQSGKQTAALLLAVRASASGSMHVMTPRDLYTGREALEATFGHPPGSKVLENGAVVESGHDFEWMRYKLLEAVI